jgi:hypothetical protein
MGRGVSDLANQRKGSASVEKWRAYACDVAAAYAIALLRSSLLPLQDQAPGRDKGNRRTGSQQIPCGTILMPIHAGIFVVDKRIKN